MKLTTITPFLFTTLALASPALVARPAAAPVVQPLAPHNQLGALAARLSTLVPDIHARAGGSGGTSGGGGGKGGSSGSSSKSSGSKSSGSKDSDSDSSTGSSGGGSKSGSSTVKPKPGKGGKNDTSAAVTLSPNAALQYGVVGLVAVEVLMQLN